MKRKQLVIIGASGQGKVAADIAKKMGYEQIVFLDDNESLTECGGYPVAGKSGSFEKYDYDMVVAIGNAEVRQKIQEKIQAAGKNVQTLIHPSAVIAENVSVGLGTVIMAGTVVNPGARIGKGCIINTASSVDHDCVIGDFVHVSVGAHVAGTVEIGERTWIGAGATVSNNVNICCDCMIGAGAVVIADIKEPGTYVGVPVRKVQK